LDHRRGPRVSAAHVFRTTAVSEECVCYTQCTDQNEDERFWGAFENSRKATISFIMSVCPSVRIEQLCSHWRDFREISYLSIFRKSVQKIKVLLRSDQNDGCFTLKPKYIFDHMSLISF
jgi:hypothetical protein